VRNNWPVNTSVESLAEVVVLFLSNEYARYSFCRKQFRLSNNIRSMQIKFNTEFYPPQPVLGNAGCPEIVDNTGDNSEFMELLLLSNNFLFNTNTPQPKINQYNFAINGRCYNPANNNPMYDPAMLNNPSYTWTGNSVNADTAMGMANFHENRYVGKAAFVYPFEPYAHSKEYMMGLDTRNSRPFDILFDCAPTGYFPTDQTMYIFTRANGLVIYG